MAWLAAKGFDVQEVKESDVMAWTRSLIEACAKESTSDASLSLCVDISSMTRVRLAAILTAILEVTDKAVDVDFVYSVARWSPPLDEPEPIVSAGAVVPAFAGWSNRTDTPIVALIGLGYEPDKAMGAYEYLEATDVWAFLPVGEDDKYLDDLNRANRTLLSRLAAQRQIAYRVDQPVACFGVLESVVYGLLPNSRPVLLPFGPKIFALCALLVACLHRDVPVWRISSDQVGKPLEREASGKIVGIRANFRAKAAESSNEIADERVVAGSGT
jgi:hypothetical protein